MGTLISGLNEAACRTIVGAEVWSSHAFAWCDLETLASDATDQLVIWLYRAPWAVPSEPAEDAGQGADLDSWLKQNRSILNLRRQLGDRLSLINVDRVSQAELHGRLTGTVSQSATNESSPASQPSFAGLVGKLFDWCSPEFWDVFEALEATAWLPSGEPIFRNNCVADPGTLRLLLDRLNRGTQAESTHQSQQSEVEEYKQESELLLVQLHQVQEELEQYYLKNLELEKSLQDNKKAVAERQKAQAEGAQLLSKTQKALTEAKKSLAQEQHKGKAQRLQLQLMQDELRHQQALATAATRAPAPAGKPTVFTRLVPGPARRVIHRARDKRALVAQLNILRKSNWFDHQWYLDTYPDIRAAKIDPATHYLTTGWRESRNPSSRFDTDYYLRSNPDITHSGLNPLWHFIAFGSKEGRLPRKP